MDRAIKDVKIFAPSEFMEHAVSENVYAGNAMGRRASYMYGAFLEHDAQGVVDNGLGKTTSKGNSSIFMPTHFVPEDNKVHNVEGVEMEFQCAAGTEAPAEMNIYFP